MTKKKNAGLELLKIVRQKTSLTLSRRCAAVYPGPSTTGWILRYCKTMMIKNTENLIQEIKFCLPNDSPCYNAVSQNNFDCVVPCTGLYADVVFTEDKILSLKTDLGKTWYLFSKSSQWGWPTVNIYFYQNFLEWVCWTTCNAFTESVPRPVQSISCNVSFSCFVACLSPLMGPGTGWTWIFLGFNISLVLAR